jgi:DNA-binding transcriptional MerR regulator
MSEEPLLTLRQVADALSLPESTTRYYRDAFLEHIPFVGTGRRRRYPPPAVAVLRLVAAGYAAGKTREAIAASLDGATPAAALPHPKGGARPDPHAVSNLELLAAIVDGEREQRDALWQMAQEILRLTDVLEGQEKVLGAIAEHAGVSPALAPAPAAPRAIGTGSAPAAEAPAPPRFEMLVEPRMPFVTVEPVAPAPPPVTPGAPQVTAAAGPGATDMEQLRVELERERALVERLREAKVKLEHRVTDAEAELDERRRRRGSLLGRILGPEPPEHDDR